MIINNKGFMLPIVMVAVISLTASLMIAKPNIIQVSNSKWDKATEAELLVIQDGLAKYYADTYTVPETAYGLSDLVFDAKPGGTPGWNGPYVNTNLSKILNDGFNNPYIYTSNTNLNAQVSVVSKGRDRIKNGDYTFATDTFPWAPVGDDKVYTHDFLNPWHFIYSYVY